MERLIEAGLIKWKDTGRGGTLRSMHTILQRFGEKIRPPTSRKRGL